MMQYVFILLVLLGISTALGSNNYSVDDCDSFVASFGNNTGNGTLEAPFFYIEQAIEMVSCLEGKDCVICIGGNVSRSYFDGKTNVHWGAKERLVLRGFNWLSTQIGKPQLFALDFNISNDFSVTLERLSVITSLAWYYSLNSTKSVNVTVSECSLSLFSNFDTLPAEIHIIDSVLTSSFNYCLQVTVSSGTSLYISGTTIQCMGDFRGKNFVMHDSVFQDISIGGPFNNLGIVEIHNSVQHCPETTLLGDCLSFGAKDEDFTVVLDNNTFTSSNKTNTMMSLDIQSSNNKYHLTLKENTFECKPASEFALIQSAWKQNYTTITLVNQAIPNSCQSKCSLGKASHKRLFLCEPCSFGYFANTTDASTCLACPIGTKGPGRGNTKCVPCEPGYAGYTTGAYLCTACTNNTYQDLPGQSTCKICPSGDTLDENTDCAPCLAAFIPKDGECVACPWYFTNNIGDLECKKPSLYLILAGAGGGVVILAALIIIMICCCCFCTKKKHAYEVVN